MGTCDLAGRREDKRAHRRSDEAAVLRSQASARSVQAERGRLAVPVWRYREGRVVRRSGIACAWMEWDFIVSVFKERRSGSASRGR